MNYAVDAIELIDLKFNYQDIDDNNEALVSADEYNLDYVSYFHDKDIPDSEINCYLRKTVAEKLWTVNKNLTDMKLRLRIYDGYRPLAVQQFLYNQYKHIIENSDMNDILSLNFYDYTPDNYDLIRPFMHNTGGAVDLILVNDRDNTELDMGCNYFHFADLTRTAYFERYDIDKINRDNYGSILYNVAVRSNIIRDNRRILYNIMTEQGFVNLPYAYWQYDYGDALWSSITGNTCLYNGLVLKG